MAQGARAGQADTRPRRAVVASAGHVDAGRLRRRLLAADPRRRPHPAVSAVRRNLEAGQPRRVEPGLSARPIQGHRPEGGTAGQAHPALLRRCSRLRQRGGIAARPPAQGQDHPRDARRRVPQGVLRPARRPPVQPQGPQEPRLPRPAPSRPRAGSTRSPSPTSCCERGPTSLPSRCTAPRSTRSR